MGPRANTLLQFKSDTERENKNGRVIPLEYTLHCWKVEQQKFVNKKKV